MSPKLDDESSFLKSSFFRWLVSASSWLMATRFRFTWRQMWVKAGSSFKVEAGRGPSLTDSVTNDLTRVHYSVKLNHGSIQKLAEAGGISPEQLAEFIKAGLSSDRIVEIINAVQIVPPSLDAAKAGHGTPLTPFIARTSCPKCHRRVPHADHCLYCGETLPATAAAKETVNEVDKKFLEDDVVESGSSKTQEKQQIRDTFEDRLKNL